MKIPTTAGKTATKPNFDNVSLEVGPKIRQFSIRFDDGKKTVSIKAFVDLELGWAYLLGKKNSNYQIFHLGFGSHEKKLEELKQLAFQFHEELI